MVDKGMLDAGHGQYVDLKGPDRDQQEVEMNESDKGLQAVKTTVH